MKWLEQFILGIPYTLLKKVPYAWLGVVYFWSWSPLLSGILLAIVLLGLVLMAWQNRAWETMIKREFHSGEARPYVDHPHFPRAVQVRNLALVLAGGAILGWLLNARFGLSGLQWSLLFAGFTLLYSDAFLFGATVTYIITDQGVGIRYVPGRADYRLFFKFREIWRAVRSKTPDELPRRWDVLAPHRRPKEGVLLVAVNSAGFSKQIQREVLLAPTDIEKFLAELTGHVTVE